MARPLDRADATLAQPVPAMNRPPVQATASGPEVMQVADGAAGAPSAVHKSWLVRFEELVSALGLFLMLFQVCLEIVLRNFFNTSFLWSEEVSRYLMIWSVYFGASAAISQGLHLRVDMVIDHVGPRVRRVLDFIAQLWVLGFSVSITVAGYLMVRDTFRIDMMSADSNLAIPLGYIQLVIPLTFGLSVVHALASLAHIVRGDRPPRATGGGH